jgi:hypothetical protein
MDMGVGRPVSVTGAAGAGTTTEVAGPSSSPYAKYNRTELSRPELEVALSRRSVASFRGSRGSEVAAHA